MKSITAGIAFTFVAMVTALALLAGTVATQSAIDDTSNGRVKHILMEDAHSIGHVTVACVGENAMVQVAE